MLTAAAEVVADRGYGGMSVARVTSRAGVSRRTFYDLFADREDCFLAVFEEAARRARLVVTEAVAGLVGWREQTRTGLAALLVFLEDERALGSLLIVDALGAGPGVLTRRARELREISEIIDRGGRASTKHAREASALTAEGIVGAVLAVIHARILEERERPLLELVNPLMGMIVLPYLGQAAAAKELSRPASKVPRPRRGPVKDPLDGLDMRLTYRTLKVLTTIADLSGRGTGGPSNREVADSAEVHDQGQISKLLARLEHLGLIRNTGQGHAKGEANAWQLTPVGEQVEQAIHTNSDR
jgi:AcrR family transcriptional regulator